MQVPSVDYWKGNIPLVEVDEGEDRDGQAAQELEKLKPQTWTRPEWNSSLKLVIRLKISLCQAIQLPDNCEIKKNKKNKKTLNVFYWLEYKSRQTVAKNIVSPKISKYSYKSDKRRYCFQRKYFVNKWKK